MEQLRIDNGEIFYEKYGNGTPIIFIHPPGLGKVVFRYQRDLSKNYCIILPDLSGHGASISHLSGSIIRQYVYEISAILEAEDIEEAVICGYSAGGMIAQEFALSNPLKTKALILSGGYPKVTTIGLHFMYRAGMYVLKKYPDMLSKLLATSHAKDKQFHKDLYHHMKKADVNHWYQFYQETYRFNCVDKLPSILAPVLCVYGEKAFWVNRHKDYYKTCPNNEIAFVNNGLHQIPTKNWQVFNQIINNFLVQKL